MNSVSGRQVLFWGGAFAVFGLIISVLSDVLLPFVLGLILAYFLNPLVTILGKKRSQQAMGDHTDCRCF